MKHALTSLALAGLCALATHAALAESQQPRGAGIETPGYVWNTPDQAIADALKQPGDVARGKIAYEICRGCHKADGAGRADADYPQLAGQHASVLIKQMVDVRAGRRDNPRMHPFIANEVVPAGELADIAAYLQSLPVPESNGKGDGKRLARGGMLYDRDCASCHGKRGEGDGARFHPRVAGQHYSYLRRESMESRDLGRRNSNPDMVRAIKPYSDQDIEAVSDYMSRLVAPAPR